MGNRDRGIGAWRQRVVAWLVFTLSVILAVPAVAEEGADEGSEQLEQAGNELRFRVIERGGADPGESERPSNEADDKKTGDSKTESEISVGAIPESLAKPMRQRRWQAAEQMLPEPDARTGGGWFAGGWIAWNRGQWEVAESRFLKSIEKKAGVPDFAALYAARSAYKADRFHRAAIMAARVSTESSQYPKALYVLGESLFQIGTSSDRAWMVRVCRAYLRHFPRGPDAPRVALILGDALAEQQKYRLAARRWEQVLREHPTSRWAKKARARFDEHQSSLPEPYDGYADSLPRELQMARWEGMYASHKSEALVADIEATIDDWSKGTRDRCQALYWLARSLTKLRRHGDAIGWYERVLTQCEGLSPFERNALYMVGKSQWNDDRLDDALASFEKLWKDFSNHSFADDVMYFAARIHRERGDEQKMAERLEVQLRRYPGGDMAPDARWLLLRRQFDDQNWSGVVEHVDRWKQHPSLLGDDLYAAGRLTYAKGRALSKLGESERARGAYREVARSHPLSYYALLSLNRLAELNRASASSSEGGSAGSADAGVDGGTRGAGGEATAAVDLCDGALSEFCAELSAEGKQVQFKYGSATEPMKPREALALPKEVSKSRIFKRGHKLLAFGAMELAAEQFRELFEIYGDDPDAMWGLAKMLDKAGAHSLSHNIARRRIAGWKRAYPAGGYIEMWRIAYPRPFSEMVTRWSDKRGLPAALVWGLMREESGFAPEVGSWAGAVGLMQLMPDTAQQTARRLSTLGESIDVPSRSDLTHPETNIQIGTGYLARLSDALEGHPALVVAGYNAGLGNVTRWLDARGDQPIDLWVEDIPYGQTRRYAKRVLASYFAYAWLGSDGGRVPGIQVGSREGRN